MEPLQGGWTEGHRPSSAGVGGGGGGDCGTMAEAIEERRRTLGRLHFWRRQHYLSVIQKSGGSKSGRTPSQRELVMALIDRRRLLLSPPEQQQMEQEYRWLHEAAQGVVGDGGDNYDDDEGSRRGDGRPPRRPRLSVRHVSPRVLRAWVAKVARCVRSALSVSLSRALLLLPPTHPLLGLSVADAEVWFGRAAAAAAAADAVDAADRYAVAYGCLTTTGCRERREQRAAAAARLDYSAYLDGARAPPRVPAGE
jgi:hypothetical protein